MSTVADPIGYQDYTAVTQENDFSHDLGLVVLPIAQQDPGHRVIRLHGGYAKRHVKWRSQRTGRPPIIPTPADTSRDTLLASSVRPLLPKPNTDGPGYDWDVSGVYTYVQNTPRIVGTDTLPVGQYPFPVNPAATYGAAIMAPYKAAYYDQATGDPLTSIMDQMTQVITVTDGQWFWPFLALPGAFASTHLIGE